MEVSAAPHPGMQIIRSGRVVHHDWLRWLSERGTPSHAYQNCNGRCSKTPEEHVPDMVLWEELPLEHQVQYERVGTGELEAAALITERCIGKPFEQRGLGIFTVTGEAFVAMLTNGRRCYEITESPFPAGGQVRDVKYDHVSNLLRVTIEGSGLPMVYKGGIAPEIGVETMLTLPLCQSCDCCHGG